MKRKIIESSNIKSIGYDVAEQILEIEFTRGAIYQYSQVPSEEVCGLLLADSLGSFFSKNIAKNYKYNQVN